MIKLIYKKNSTLHEFRSLVAMLGHTWWNDDNLPPDFIVLLLCTV